jgi:predicted GH43/DUF377 family glycosyl hydrolase
MRDFKLFFLMSSIFWMTSSSKDAFATINESTQLKTSSTKSSTTTFSVYSAVPVFTKLTTLEEDGAIGSPDVITFKKPKLSLNSFKMVYAQGGTDTKGRIGMAESDNGINWVRNTPTGTVLSPSASGWDSHFLDTPSILKKGKTWYMWYYGSSSNNTVGAAIGLATSRDGINFTKHANNPVLTKGADGAWDSLWVESPSVIYDGTKFVMFYTGIGANWLPQIGQATSTDGVNWVKNLANPTFVRNPNTTAWDSYAAAVSSVSYDNGVYNMVYAAVSIADIMNGLQLPQLGLLESNNGTNWVRSRTAPIITTAGAGNLPGGPYNPSILWDASRNKYNIYYESGYGFGLSYSN